MYQIHICISGHSKFNMEFFIYLFFNQGFPSQRLTIHRTAGEGRGPSYSTLPLPPAHEHWDIFLQLCTWDDYHVFLIATLVFNQTAIWWDLSPYQITIWLIDWWCNVYLLTWWIDSRFLLQQFDIGNRWIWTITLVLQANWVTKCTNHGWESFLFFFKIVFTLNYWLLWFLGCLTYNIESAITFAILEK